MAQVNDVGGGEPIAIRVKDQVGEETMFTIRRTTKMGKVFKAFAERKGVDERELRYTIDGERINPEDTPIDLGLQDEDVIEVIRPMIGMISTFTSSDTSNQMHSLNI